MTRKTPFDSYINIAEESAWADGGAGSDIGCNIITNWELDPAAPQKEVVWGTDRENPAQINNKMKEPMNLDLSTRNIGSVYPLYACLGSKTDNGSNNYTIALDNGNVLIAFHINHNGTEYKVEGCVIDQCTLNIPEDGGNITLDYKAICADIERSPGSINAKNQHTAEIMASDGVYVVKKNDTAINDVFIGGKITFKNNYNTEHPDVENARIYEPVKQNFELEIELNFRLDDDDNFIQSYLEGDHGVFSIEFDIYDGDGDGLKVHIDGLGIQGFSEPVPTAETGVIEQSVTFRNFDSTLDIESNNLEV
jgi:hypothetical protein